MALLILAGTVVATSIVLDRFPEATAELLARLTDGRASRRSWPRDEGHGREVTEWSGHRARGLWIATLVLLLAAQVAVAAQTTVVLAVEGMTWGSWPITVKRALEGLTGVSRAEVSFRDQEARVVFDPDEVRVEQLIDVVNRAGFRASLTRTE